MIKTKVIDGKVVERDCVIYNVPTLGYIRKAMKQFNDNNCVFVVFSGGKKDDNNSNDMSWCKKNIQAKYIEYSANRDAIDDFALLTKCNHYIISFGSFGWWGDML